VRPARKKLNRWLQSNDATSAIAVDPTNEPDEEVVDH
jgi:hypothetical protein